ncbi:MAG: hypothetical protein ONB12_00365 [candidate division KSB1 bacterium]|nr:hypothetical protein [candidate division KSB1 bacterium]
MSAPPFSFQAALPFAVIFLAAFLSCFNPFAPRLEKSSPQALFLTEQKSPDEVLQNFVYAYTFKDSLVYADLLDSSFVFVYFDPSLGGSGRFVSWGRDVDLKTTGQLFRNTETITLTWNSTIYQDTLYVGSQMVGIELSKTLQLYLSGSFGDYTFSGSAVFNFKKCSDNKWRITRWKDESSM